MKLKAILTLLLAFSVSKANAARPASSYGGLSLRATGIANDSAYLSNGSELKRNSGLFSLSYKQPLSRHFSTSVSAKYDLLDVQWTAPSLFQGTTSPFGQVKRYGAGLSLMYRTDDGLMLLLSPTMQYAYAEGAKRSDAHSWGLVTSAMKRYKSGNMLGLGLGYFNDINKVRTIFFIAINWQINQQWSLGNPFDTGFSGPAGLEIKYQLTPKLQFGLGGSKRSQRFLIAAEHTSTVEINEWVSFLRAGYQYSQDLSLNAYLGYIFSSELKLSDPGREEGIDNHLGSALSFSYKF